VESVEIIEGLRCCELLVTLDEEGIRLLTESLAGAWEIKEYRAGEHIFDQGEHSSRLYIIVDGQVLLQREVNIGDKKATWPLGFLGKGRAMGWSAVLYGPRYASASAVCQKPSSVISIEGTALRAVLERKPEIGFLVIDRLACMLGERLRAAYNTLEAHL